MKESKVNYALYAPDVARVVLAKTMAVPVGASAVQVKARVVPVGARAVLVRAKAVLVGAQPRKHFSHWPSGLVSPS